MNDDSNLKCALVDIGTFVNGIDNIGVVPDWKGIKDFVRETLGCDKRQLDTFIASAYMDSREERNAAAELAELGCRIIPSRRKKNISDAIISSEMFDMACGANGDIDIGLVAGDSDAAYAVELINNRFGPCVSVFSPGKSLASLWEEVLDPEYIYFLDDFMRRTTYSPHVIDELILSSVENCIQNGKAPTISGTRRVVAEYHGFDEEVVGERIRQLLGKGKLITVNGMSYNGNMLRILQVA